MPLDGIDKGKIKQETDAMRKARETMLLNSPPAQFFKLRAELLKQGRSNQRIADTGNCAFNAGSLLPLYKQQQRLA